MRSIVEDLCKVRLRARTNTGPHLEEELGTVSGSIGCATECLGAASRFPPASLSERASSNRSDEAFPLAIDQQGGPARTAQPLPPLRPGATVFRVVPFGALSNLRLGLRA